MKNLAPKITHVVDYFSFFSYAPTIDEIHTFLSSSASRSDVEKALEKMIKEGIITKISSKKPSFRDLKLERYTPGEYVGNIKYQIANSKNSVKKIKKIDPYIKLLSYFSQIQLIALSGSVAMMSAAKEEDIDLFIITSRNRLWTGRAIALLTAQLMGIRRKRVKGHHFARRALRAKEGERVAEVRDKVCLNLFFDEKNMAIPARKRTEYVGHEVLQVKPLFDRKNVYSRFLEANSWVFDLFPNAKKEIFNFHPPAGGPVSKQISNTKSQNNSLTRELVNLKIFKFIGDWIEHFLKKLQLTFIYRHRTTEIITDTQLWFFPDDFEKKLP